MHGRLKVKTTAQQGAEKKAARNEKMKVYQGAMSMLLSNREEQFEAQLKMTAGLLQANPDITTLWNIRREALLQLFDKCPDDDSRDGLLRRDLDLSQDCLLTNPKSYGAWHHRCWCLKQMSNPDWKHEMMLCNKYLALDERNFHVWDYRRFIACASNISPKDELAYTSERINVNFSNYSAWHYRSKLIPKVYPGSESTSEVMSEEKRREELDLVQNAAFTDPEDSSAWFYHKWVLLGGKSHSKFAVIALKHDANTNQLFLATNNLCDGNTIAQVFVDGSRISAQWSPAQKDEPADSLWICKSCPEVFNKISVKVKDSEISLTKEESFFWKKAIQDTGLEDKTKSLLEEELENCSALLEMEPESKWTHYAKVLIMESLDETKYHDEIFNELVKLSELDDKRCRYYLDMRSKKILETSLSEMTLNLDLSRKGLTCLFFKERFFAVNQLNLSQNMIESVDTLLPYLLNCKELILDETCLKKIDHIPSGLSLKEISIRKTPFSINESAVQNLRDRYPTLNIITI